MGRVGVAADSGVPNTDRAGRAVATAVAGLPSAVLAVEVVGVGVGGGTRATVGSMTLTVTPLTRVRCSIRRNWSLFCVNPPS